MRVTVDNIKKVKTACPNETKYLKYVPKIWEQPVCTKSNTEYTRTTMGTMGGNFFAAEGTAQFTQEGGNYYIINLFDNATSRVEWTTFPCWVTWYNPNPINVKQIAVYNDLENTIRAICDYQIHASNDNSTWTTLYTGSNYDESTGTNIHSIKGETWYIDLGGNTGYYKYYKLYVTSKGNRNTSTGGWNVTECGDLTITATEKVLVEGSPSDYDLIVSDVQPKTMNYPERKYFSRAKVYDCTLIGSPTFASPYLYSSGANSYGYRLFSSDMKAAVTPTSSFEMVLRYSFESMKNYNNIVNTNTNNSGIILTANSSNVIYAYIGDGSAWRVSNKTTGITASVHNYEYIKVTWDGANYIFYSSSDGSTWTQTATYASTYAINLTDGLCLCGCTRQNYYFEGWIDLDNSYVKIDSVQYNFYNYKMVESTSQTNYYVDIE